MTLFPNASFSRPKVTKFNNGNANKIEDDDKSIHSWYRFVLSFPPHLVREYIQHFELRRGDTLLDPFCGTGTAILESKLNGLLGVGIEANPLAYFSSLVKTNFDIRKNTLLNDSVMIAKEAEQSIREYTTEKLMSLTREKYSLLITDSISPIPLHKTLILLNAIREFHSEYMDHQLLALASSTVRCASNLSFGPEVGVSKKKKADTDVVLDWLETIKAMVRDLREIDSGLYFPCKLHCGDSRYLEKHLDANSIHAVFTSPPYPNEKDYTRTTRLESVLLGFINNKNDLKNLKQGLLRSNSRNVYRGDDDDKHILHCPDVIKIAKEIERRRIDMKKTSGFERQYHRVTRLYFGGMAKHLESLKPFLRRNALLGYVVGDQASYLQVHIPTGKILADIASALGYKVVDIKLFRTRFATATKKNMNEEVVILRWRG